MTSFASGLGNVVGQGVGLSKSTGLFKELTGQAGRVQIIQPGYGCLLQFDACINEQHGQEAQVTTNPIMGGGVVADHIIVQPIPLVLTGVVSDTPLYDAQRFLTQTIGNAVGALLPPLGIIAEATAYQLTHPQDAALTPSHEAYRTLMKLAAGDPTASPPTLPVPFDVVTAYRRYTDMVITSLQFPRDASTSGTCVFTMQLQQVVVVQPQFVNVAIIENKKLGASLKKNGELEAKVEKIKGIVAAGAEAGRTSETAAATAIKGAASVFGLGG